MSLRKKGNVKQKEEEEEPKFNVDQLLGLAEITYLVELAFATAQVTDIASAYVVLMLKGMLFTRMSLELPHLKMSL
jgi:hypothetical protein